MDQDLSNAVIMLIPVVATIGLFVALSVWIWASQRRRERESFYRYELGQKLIEADKLDREEVLKLLRSGSPAADPRQRWLGVRLAGVVTLFLGLGALLGLGFIAEADVYLLGYIPLMVGVGILLFSFFARPGRSSPSADG